MEEGRKEERGSREEEEGGMEEGRGRRKEGAGREGEIVGERKEGGGREGGKRGREGGRERERGGREGGRKGTSGSLWARRAARAFIFASILSAVACRPISDSQESWSTGKGVQAWTATTQTCMDALSASLSCRPLCVPPCVRCGDIWTSFSITSFTPGRCSAACSALQPRQLPPTPHHV